MTGYSEHSKEVRINKKEKEKSRIKVYWIEVLVSKKEDVLVKTTTIRDNLKG